MAVGALLLLSSLTAAAGEPTSYTWYDGGQPVKVWVDPSAMARVVVDPAHRESPLVTIVRVRERAGDGVWSPVFTTTSNGGRRLTLPGNVIVYLSKALDENGTRAWLASHRLTVVTTINPEKNGFVVAAPAGLESLRLANELRADRSVVAAAPVWWREVSRR